MTARHYPVIDLFSGPGGLGEGFSSVSGSDPGNTSGFRIVISVEKDKAARETLKTRACFRYLQDHASSLDHWYDWLNRGGVFIPANADEKEAWKFADQHARLHELGADPQADETLHDEIGELLTAQDLYRNSVLIGGPPCQAYSLAGRSRNAGNKYYFPEQDARHFLYEEYLKIIKRVQPAIFVMENVRGILTSKINGRRIFPRILQDLVSRHGNGLGYEIHSLVTDSAFRNGDNPHRTEGADFLIKSENYGIPQKRHRIILLGIREDLIHAGSKPGKLVPSREKINVNQAISDLPRLRSRLSRSEDSTRNWNETLKWLTEALQRGLKHTNLFGVGNDLHLIHQEREKRELSHGANRFPRSTLPLALMPDSLATWLLDSRLNVILNHESRGHIEQDLQRYLFVSSFGRMKSYSPKVRDFPEFLAPEHQNWNSGKFADRFRVQLEENPATTITSHISKDGHYFIHPDPVQCRSLTVREAARLQTFPDNYIFMGNRTEQYTQVGNAVPPYLARQIAQIVLHILDHPGT
jgi:DNA (cytosine-5)-methyltransferase 1